MLRLSIHAGLPAVCPSVLVVLVVAVSALAGVVAPPEVLPTEWEIHQLFEQKQYPQVLQRIAKVLTLKGEPAKAYNRHELMRLRAETHLRLKAYGAAEQAFAAAAGEAEDRTSAGVDLSTSVLIHRSKNNQYQPTAKVKGKIPDPISIIEPESRKLALKALFDDQLAIDGPKITAVRDAVALDPLCKVAPLVTDLKILEMGATEGRDDQTRQLISENVKNAQSMMADTVHDLVARQTVIVNRANEDVEYYKPASAAGRPYQQLNITKRGYCANDRKDLAEIRLTCEKIAPAARAFGDAMGAEGLDLMTTAVTAERLAKQTGS